MAKKQVIEIEGRSSLDPGTLYGLLAEGATWPRWSPIRAFELEQPGPNGGESVGAVRVFRTGRVTSRERIVELVPDRRLGYELLSGLPLRGYRATVDVVPEQDGGTRITWRSSFTAKRLGTGWLYRFALRRFIRQMVDGLSRPPAELLQPAARPEGLLSRTPA
jgi:hypothetical protein